MNKRDITVGIFVVTGIALFTLAIFLIGNSHRAFTQHFELYTEFSNLGGLAKGAKVQVGGLDAGEVESIAIPDSPPSKFRLKLKIEQPMHGLVRTDSVVTIATQGVVGDKLLMIQPGTANSPEAGSSTTLPSKEPLDLADVMAKSADLVKDAGGTMKVVSGKLNVALDTVTTTVNNANDIVVGLKQGKGTAGVFLNDPVTAANVRQSIANVRQATESLNHAASQGDSLVSDLQSRQLGQKADDAMTSVRSAADSFDKTSRQVHDTVTSALAPDARGVDAGTNIRQSLSSISVATGNMAEDTEALKHEFFFRGFFKKRGYYSLASVDPEKYRTDQAFSRLESRRVWLQGSDLFVTLDDGKEVLTETGKERIDSAVAQLGDSFVASTSVIEGYSGAGSAGEQLARSRSRATLVRQYLHARFQLDLQNVGAVALRSTPPASAHKDTWDGICIRLLKSRG